PGLQQSLNKTAKTASVGFGKTNKMKDGLFEIPLEGKVDTEIAGLQFDISYDPNEVTLLEPALTSHTEGLQVFSSAQEGTQKIGLIDLNGQNYVLAGEGPLIMLRGKGTNLSSITIKEATLVDRDANKIPVEIIAVMKDEEGLDAEGSIIPKNFVLSQNLPNPFNPETQISYDLPSACQVKLCIYNLLGQKARTLLDEYQSAGHKIVNWDGKDDRGNGLASGVYFYRIQAGDFTDAKKMIMIK
ncbi:MAG TPA: T9SS type A sorting domain-containing protein, partial [candidate division Zixibacteria bacterium]